MQHCVTRKCTAVRGDAITGVWLQIFTESCLACEIKYNRIELN